LQLTSHLKEVLKPLWNEDFSGNPEKSEVMSWALEFGKFASRANFLLSAVNCPEPIGESAAWSEPKAKKFSKIRHQGRSPINSNVLEGELLFFSY